MRMILPLFCLLLLFVNLLRYLHTSLRHAILQNTTPPSFLLSRSTLRRRYSTLAMVSYTFPILRNLLVMFDTAHESGMLPLSSVCALEACAPEVVFARIVENIDNPPVELPADIWALGTAVCFFFLPLSLLILFLELRSTRLLQTLLFIVVGDCLPSLVKWLLWLVPYHPNGRPGILA